MYQQNSYQPQGYGSQQYQPSQGGQQQVYLQEQDLANFVLSELKRTAREYTTATLEAANPQIRQAFQTLLQKTLQDQVAVFQEIQKLGGYDTQPADQQQLQQEMQKQSQTAAKLQTFVGQNLSRAGGASASASASGYQQANQVMAQQQQQQSPSMSQNQSQIAALQQAPFQPVPTISSSAFPNAVYSQSVSQSLQQAHNQQQPYSGQQGQNFQHQNMTSRNQPGSRSSQSTWESSYSGQHEGSKYSF